MVPWHTEKTESENNNEIAKFTSQSRQVMTQAPDIFEPWANWLIDWFESRLEENIWKYSTYEKWENVNENEWKREDKVEIAEGRNTTRYRHSYDPLGEEMVSLPTEYWTGVAPYCEEKM